MINFQLPKFAFYLPWFIYDIGNKQLITSQTIPDEITDNKEIILTETPIPGLNYQPITPGGGGNRKISLTLPLIKRNNSVGNILMLKQFDNLRNQNVGLTGVFSNQFTPNPQVLYYWGVGSVPLVYWVKKCDFAHSGGWVNELANPQYTAIQLELWLDETNPLYKLEELFRKFESLTGSIINTYNVVESQRLNQRIF